MVPRRFCSLSLFISIKTVKKELFEKFFLLGKCFLIKFGDSIKTLLLKRFLPEFFAFFPLFYFLWLWSVAVALISGSGDSELRSCRFFFLVHSFPFLHQSNVIMQVNRVGASPLVIWLAAPKMNTKLFCLRGNRQKRHRMGKSWSVFNEEQEISSTCVCECLSEPNHDWACPRLS